MFRIILLRSLYFWISAQKTFVTFDSDVHMLFFSPEPTRLPIDVHDFYQSIVRFELKAVRSDRDNWIASKSPIDLFWAICKFTCCGHIWVHVPSRRIITKPIYSREDKTRVPTSSNRSVSICFRFLFFFDFFFVYGISIVQSNRWPEHARAKEESDSGWPANSSRYGFQRTWTTKTMKKKRVGQSKRERGKVPGTSREPKQTSSCPNNVVCVESRAIPSASHQPTVRAGVNPFHFTFA